MSTQRNSTPQPSRGRNIATAVAAIIAPIAATIAACSDNPVTEPTAATRAPSALLAPAPKPSAKDDANRLTNAQLAALATTFRTTFSDQEPGFDRPLNIACGSTGSAQTSRVIGPDGGVLTFGKGTLTIPRGALSTNVDISARLTFGQSVNVDFAPHGLKFAKAVTVVAAYSGCTVPAGGAVNAYYTNLAGDITQSMPVAHDAVAKTATFLTDHFSGYAVGWGRTSTSIY